MIFLFPYSEIQSENAPGAFCSKSFATAALLLIAVEMNGKAYPSSTSAAKKPQQEALKQKAQEMDFMLQTFCSI